MHRVSIGDLLWLQKASEALGQTIFDTKLFGTAPTASIFVADLKRTRKVRVEMSGLLGGNRSEIRSGTLEARVHKNIVVDHDMDGFIWAVRRSCATALRKRARELERGE